MRTSAHALLATRAARPLPTFARGLRLVRDWLSLRREREALSRLDARLLRDIGVDAADAAQESARPFWDLPRNR